MCNECVYHVFRICRVSKLLLTVNVQFISQRCAARGQTWGPCPTGGHPSSGLRGHALRALTWSRSSDRFYTTAKVNIQRFVLFMASCQSRDDGVLHLNGVLRTVLGVWICWRCGVTPLKSLSCSGVLRPPFRGVSMLVKAIRFWASCK